MDSEVCETTERVWAGIDCTACANCSEPDFAFRTIAMIERTATCPIVYEVIEDLKRSWRFSKPNQR